MHRFGSVIGVDARGWLLLQERDEHPVIDPECWGFCGGHLEDGEDPTSGALRELAEETGIALTGADLALVAEERVFHEAYGTWDRAWVFAAALRVPEAEVVQGEGRRIVYVEPQAALTLPLTRLTGQVLPRFVGSDLHRRLAASASG